MKKKKKTANVKNLTSFAQHLHNMSFHFLGFLFPFDLLLEIKELIVTAGRMNNFEVIVIVVVY